MESVAWMAWTPATGLFFVFIASMLGLLTVLALRYPETERVGILTIPTTRGDRLFISLLGAAFIHLIFLAVFGPETFTTLPIAGGVEVSRLWIATALSLLYAAAVFRWV
jgi:predicted small integral membrane protein